MEIHGTRSYSPYLPEMLASIDAECFDKSTAMSREDWQDFFDHHTLWMVRWITEGDKAVAAGVVVYTDVGIAYLYSNATIPEFQKHGYGNAIVQDRLDYVQDKVHLVQAHTKIDNIPSQKLLKRHGFKAIQYVPDFYDDAVDAILWEKRNNFEV